MQNPFNSAPSVFDLLWENKSYKMIFHDCGWPYTCSSIWSRWAVDL